MRRSRADLAVTAALAVIATAAAAAGAPMAVTAVLGIALFAAPGYLLGQLLLGSRIAGLERVLVAAGLALAVPILGGLLLSAMGVPLHKNAWVGLLAAVTLAGDAGLLASRRGQAAPAARRPPAGRRPAMRRLPPRHAAAFGAAVLVAGCGLGLARIGVAMQPYPGFTQLWLSPGGDGARTASLGVSNKQGTKTRYRLILLRHGRVSATWNLTLGNGQTWQRTLRYSGRYAIAADLYRLPDLSRPYRYVAATAYVASAGYLAPGS